MDSALNSVLSNSFKKIDRSMKFIIELMESIEEYKKNNPIDIKTIHDEIRGIREHVFVDRISIADEISLSIGDAAHNARVALDYVVYELIHNRVENKGRIQFPFAKNRENLDSVMRLNQITALSEAAQDVIRASCPYPGGNRSLNGLHQLDIQDKHRYLVGPRILYVATTDFLNWVEPSGVELRGDGKMVHDIDVNTPFLNIKIPRPNRAYRRAHKSYVPRTFIRSAGPIDLAFVFQDGPFKGQEVISSLLTITTDAGNLCQQIAEAELNEAQRS